MFKIFKLEIQNYLKELSKRNVSQERLEQIRDRLLQMAAKFDEKMGNDYHCCTYYVNECLEKDKKYLRRALNKASQVVYEELDSVLQNEASLSFSDVEKKVYAENRMRKRKRQWAGKKAKKNILLDD